MKNTTNTTMTATALKLLDMHKQLQKMFEIECDIEFEARRIQSTGGNNQEEVRLTACITDSLYQALCAVSSAANVIEERAAQKRDDVGLERLVDNAMVDCDPRTDIDWMSNGAD
jgi:hypothetical protein